MDISLHGAGILIPQWVIKRQILKKDDLVDFHLPFLFNGETFNQGTVAWVKNEKESGGITCGVKIETRAPLYYPVFVSFDNKSINVDMTEFKTSENLLTRILKDTILLKKGILIYLNHIKPMLPRITQLDGNNLNNLRNFLFDDVKKRADKNIRLLSDYLEKVAKDTCSSYNIQKFMDLEELRDIMEPELESAVWQNAFEQKTMLQYIQAIVTLEKKVFYNYNTLVMLYVNALTNENHSCSGEDLFI